MEYQQLALAVLVNNELTDVFYLNDKFACEHVDQVNVPWAVLLLQILETLFELGHNLRYLFVKLVWLQVQISVDVIPYFFLSQLLSF